MPVVLNIGTRDIRLVAHRENRILKWERVSITPGLVEDGHILQPRELARVIDSLFSSLKLARDQVMVCVEGLSYTYRTLNLPRLKSSLMEEAIERAARKEIPLPPEELYLDWLITGGTQEEVEVFIVGAPRSLVEAVVETLRMARVSMVALGLKSLALARAAGKTDAIIVDFEPDCFDITIVAAGVPAIMHTVTPKGDRSNLEDGTTQLIDELNRTIDFHNIAHPKNPIEASSPLLLSGSLAQEESVAGHIGQGTGHPVELLTVPIPLPEGLPIAIFAGAIGLFLKRAVLKTSRNRESDKLFDINVDLLNGRRRVLARHVSGRRSLLPVLVAVFFVLTLIPLYFARNNAVADTAFSRADLERRNNNLRLARSQADTLAQTEVSIKKLRDETNSLEKGHELITGRGETSNIIQYVAYSMPRQASYTTIDVSAEGISVDGEAPTRTDVLNYVVQLEKYSKFAGVRIALMEDKVSEDGKSKSVLFSIKVER